MYTLHFSPDDLDANRQGCLSEAQQTRLNQDVAMLRRQGRWTVMGFLVMFVVLFGVGGLNEYRNAGENLSKLLTPPTLMGFGIMGGMFVLVTTISLGVNAWTINRFASGRIHTVEGRAKLKTVTGRYGSKGYTVKIGGFGGVTFTFMSEQSQRYFREGRSYRVYYLPYMVPQALSTEEIETENAKRDR